MTRFKTNTEEKMVNKKAQGLSITTIIVAAIALIVLVVLIAIFTGRIGVFSQGVSEATSCNEICVSLGHESGKPGTADQVPGNNEVKPLGARDQSGQPCICKKK